jgi:hypothetical protein
MFKDVGDSSVGGVSYEKLSTREIVYFHHCWYQTFSFSGNFELSLWNLCKEYELIRSEIKKKYT